MIVENSNLELREDRAGKVVRVIGLNEDNVSTEDTRGGVIDQAQLASLREIQQSGEADLVTELIDLFVNETVSQLKVLHEAVSSNDATEIRRLAHRLKGGSANMGVTRMAALSGELESKDPAMDARELLGQLENEFVLVREAFKSERKEA